MAVNVISAAYGGLRDGNPNQAEAADVTQALQQFFDANPGARGLVTINNQTMGGDPAVGVLKHFGAIVDVDGNRFSFACQENQTIDFT
jgi:hypothetical protein